MSQTDARPDRNGSSENTPGLFQEKLNAAFLAAGTTYETLLQADLYAGSAHADQIRDIFTVAEGLRRQIALLLQTITGKALGEQETTPGFGAQEPIPVLRIGCWHPYNEELRRKALLATLNAVSHEPDPAAIGCCALDWIEDLSESIGHPMSSQQALALYQAHLQASLEPGYETWCQPERMPFEDETDAATRLRLQQEISEEFSSGLGEEE